MNDSRQAILARVRANRPPAVELPSLEADWVMYDDLAGQFAATVELIGGTVCHVTSPEEAHRELLAIASYDTGAPQISLVPGIGHSNIALDTLATPHELAQLEWAILPGEFGVAENGAIWVTDRSIRHRAVYFLGEHLVLTLPRNAIVHNMHEAYARLGTFAHDNYPPFATFIAGPSKTADIEQSLVIGAQGPRSLTVMLLEET